MSDIDKIEACLDEDKERGYVPVEGGSMPEEQSKVSGPLDGPEVVVTKDAFRLPKVTVKQAYAVAKKNVTKDVLQDIMDIMELMIKTILLAPYRAISIYIENYVMSSDKDRITRIALIFSGISVVISLGLLIFLEDILYISFIIGAILLALFQIILYLKVG